MRYLILIKILYDLDNGSTYTREINMFIFAQYFTKFFFTTKWSSSVMTYMFVTIKWSSSNSFPFYLLKTKFSSCPNLDESWHTLILYILVYISFIIFYCKTLIIAFSCRMKPRTCLYMHKWIYMNTIFCPTSTVHNLGIIIMDIFVLLYLFTLFIL